MSRLARSVAVLLAAVLAAPSRASTPLPGGVLDSTGRTAYLAGPAGIDAVGLARGDLLWTTREAQVPLVVVADRLYALARPGRQGEAANVLHVLGFDLTRSGKRAYRSEPITLPAWASASEGPGRSFRCSFERRERTLILAWQAAAWSDLGPRKEAAGVVRIDLEDGKVTGGKVGPLPPPAAQRPPQLEKLSVRWQRRAGGQLHAVVLEDLPGSTAAQRKQRLVLRIWNEKTGKESPPRELLRGSKPTVLEGIDGIHLWLRDAAPSPDEVGLADKALGRFSWAIYSGLDGHLVARAPFLPGTREAALLGDRVYFRCAATLRSAGRFPTRGTSWLCAVQVESGKTLWRRPIAPPLGR
jgi:hypothetical protein